MAGLKIRVELKRAGKGVEMPRLADLARETQKLLRLVAGDVGMDAESGVWVAEDFYEQGIGFDAVLYATEFDDMQAHKFTKTIGDVLTVGPETNWYVSGVRPITMVQSAKVAKIAGEDEVVRIGIYNGQAGPSWGAAHQKPGRSHRGTF